MKKTSLFTETIFAGDNDETNEDKQEQKVNNIVKTKRVIIHKRETSSIPPDIDNNIFECNNNEAETMLEHENFSSNAFNFLANMPTFRLQQSELQLSLPETLTTATAINDYDSTRTFESIFDTQESEAPQFSENNLRTGFDLTQRYVSSLNTNRSHNDSGVFVLNVNIPDIMFASEK